MGTDRARGLGFVKTGNDFDLQQSLEDEDGVKAGHV